MKTFRTCVRGFSAAAVALFVAVGGCSSSAGAPSLTEAEALATVESAFAAYNTGDMDTWILWREGGSGFASDVAYEVAAGSRLHAEECTYRGFGEWQVDGALTGHGFDCAVTQSDRILEAAGIELAMTYNWVIGEGPESSLGGSNEDFGFVEAFMGEFRAWMEANHAEVAAATQYESGSDRPAPGSVSTVLEYIDEFVAQSDAYPLTTPVPAGEYGGPLSS